MLTISNPLSASQAQAYHAEEFWQRPRELLHARRTRYAANGTEDLPSNGDCAVRSARNTSSGSRKASIRSLVSSSSATKRHGNT